MSERSCLPVCPPAHLSGLLSFRGLSLVPSSRVGGCGQPSKTPSSPSGPQFIVLAPPHLLSAQLSILFTRAGTAIPHRLPTQQWLHSLAQGDRNSTRGRAFARTASTNGCPRGSGHLRSRHFSCQVILVAPLWYKQRRPISMGAAI